MLANVPLLLLLAVPRFRWLYRGTAEFRNSAETAKFRNSAKTAEYPETAGRGGTRADSRQRPPKATVGASRGPPQAAPQGGRHAAGFGGIPESRENR